MSNIQGKISNSRPNLIKTRRSMNQLPRLTLPRAQRRASEDLTDFSIPQMSQISKPLKIKNLSQDSPLSPTTQKLLLKSENLKFRITDSLSLLKSVNSAYIENTQDLVQGISLLEKDVSLLKSEFKEIDRNLNGLNPVKSLLNTPKTATTGKEGLSQGKYKTKVCKALEAVREDIRELSQRLEHNEKISENQDLRESWEYYRNMMTADTFVDTNEKLVDCKSCIAF